MKIRTKICLVCVAAMLVMSQCYSAFMLHVSLKTQLAQIYAYESNTFHNKLKELDTRMRNFGIAETDTEIQEKIMQDGIRHYLGLEYAVYRDGEEIYNPTPYDFGKNGDSYPSYYEVQIDGRYLLIMGSTYDPGGENTYDIWHFNDVTGIHENSWKMFLKGLAAAFLLTAVIAAGMVLVIRVILHPLYSLRDSANEIAGGNYAFRIPIKKMDEVGEISGNFNRMAEKIEEHVETLSDTNEKQRQLLGSLAHELKTPMTAIIGYSDILLKMSLSEQQKEKALQYIGSESRRLSRLSAKMLELTGLYEEEPESLEMRHTSAKVLLERAEALISFRLQERGQILEIRLADDALCYDMDEDLMTSLLLNFLDNACKASDEGQKIYLEADSRGIYVSDCGIGIPEEELTKVEDAFYMVDKSRARASGGSGLGLALCRRIAELHHAEMRIESRQGEGTKVSILWK